MCQCEPSPSPITARLHGQGKSVTGQRPFLMITFWGSEAAIRAFAGDDIEWRNTRFRQDFLLELEPCSTHYEMYDR